MSLVIVGRYEATTKLTKMYPHWLSMSPISYFAIAWTCFRYTYGKLHNYLPNVPTQCLLFLDDGQKMLTSAPIGSRALRKVNFSQCNVYRPVFSFVCIKIGSKKRKELVDFFQNLAKMDCHLAGEALLFLSSPHTLHQGDN